MTARVAEFVAGCLLLAVPFLWLGLALWREDGWRGVVAVCATAAAIGGFGVAGIILVVGATR